jgi:hypothetical protein
MPLEDVEDESLRYRMVTNIIGDESPPGLAPRLFAQLHLTHAGEPTNYTEAQCNPVWEAAIE